MYFRACMLGTALLLTSPLPGQQEPDRPAVEQEKIVPLTEPSPETRPAGEKAASVKFEVENGLDLGTDERGRVVVESVKAKADAANAGVKEGDILIQVNDTPINSAIGLSKYLQDQQDWNAHIVKFRRGDKEFEVTFGKKVDMLGMTVFSDKSRRPLIRKIEKGSPADRAGLHVGDLISGISGREIETLDQFSEFAIPLVRKMSEGQEIPLRLVRDGDDIDVNIIRPEDAALPLIPAPKEEPRPVMRTKEKVIEKHTVTPVQVADDDDEGYVGGLSGFQGDGGSGLALDFSNNGVQPFTNVTAVSAMLHHVGSARRGAALSSPPTNLNSTGTGVNNTATGVNSRISGNRSNTGTHTGGITTQQTPSGTIVNGPNSPGGIGNAAIRRLNQGAGANVGTSTTTNAVANAENAIDEAMNHDDMSDMSGMGHMSAGFVLVQSNGTQTVLNARMAGFAAGTYRLAVYEFGDCGDVMNGSAGQGAVELGQFSVDRSGRGFLATALTGIAPEALLGRVVAVTPIRVNEQTPTTNPANRPLDQGVRSGNQRRVPRNPTANPNDGQAALQTDSQSFFNVSASRAPIELAQVPRTTNKVAGQATEGSSSSGNPAAAGAQTQPGTQTTTPPNSNLQNNPNLQNALNAQNAMNNNSANRRIRNTRQACGVFGFANPGRPFLPLEGGTGTINNNINNNGTINNGTINNTPQNNAPATNPGTTTDPTIP
ncbi:MAG: PDZ domain-containing protein [Planctomycetaceae bacterium]